MKSYPFLVLFFYPATLLLGVEGLPTIIPPASVGSVAPVSPQVPANNVLPINNDRPVIRPDTSGKTNGAGPQVGACHCPVGEREKPDRVFHCEYESWNCTYSEKASTCVLSSGRRYATDIYDKNPEGRVVGCDGELSTPPENCAGKSIEIQKPYSSECEKISLPQPIPNKEKYIEDCIAALILKDGEEKVESITDLAFSYKASCEHSYYSKVLSPLQARCDSAGKTVPSEKISVEAVQSSASMVLPKIHIRHPCPDVVVPENGDLKSACEECKCEYTSWCPRSDVDETPPKDDTLPGFPASCQPSAIQGNGGPAATSISAPGSSIIPSY